MKTEIKYLIVCLSMMKVSSEPPIPGYKYQQPRTGFQTNFGIPSSTYLPPKTEYVAPSSDYLPPTSNSNSRRDSSYQDHGPSHGHENEVPKSYEFGYAVKDAYSGNDYNRHESSDGNVVRGEYRVQLPDGRTQIAIIHTHLQILKCQTIMKDVSIDLNARLNYFDTELLKSTVDDKDGNVMVSPLTIRNTLAMILEGAVGDTAVEISDALRLSRVKQDHRNELKLYLNGLKTVSLDAVLDNANALFVNKKLKFKEEYIKTVKNVYNSEIVGVDFKNQTSAAKTLNEWVFRKTKGHIPAIIQPDQIEPLSEVVVANALFFKSMWKYAFKIRNRAASFYSRGNFIKVTMMELDAVVNYGYIRDLRALAVDIPYQDDRYSMLLLVPQDRDGVSNVIRDLPFMNLPNILNLMAPTKIRLSMPKFTVNYGENMAPILRNMRIRSLFEPTANLSNIFEGTTPHVTTIYHKVYMDVNENGTVAAAVSLANVVPLINNGDELRVDRPFIFFIRDNQLGLVLFQGRIDDPVEYPKAPSPPKHHLTVKPQVNKTAQANMSHRGPATTPRIVHKEKTRQETIQYYATERPFLVSLKNIFDWGRR